MFVSSDIFGLLGLIDMRQWVAVGVAREDLPENSLFCRLNRVNADAAMPEEGREVQSLLALARGSHGTKKCNEMSMLPSFVGIWSAKTLCSLQLYS